MYGNSVKGIYEYIEKQKAKYANNQSLVYILEYCQGCVADDLMYVFPSTIMVDENHCKVTVLYERPNGESLKLIFHEGHDDEIAILYAGDLDGTGSNVKTCTWKEIAEELETW
jgi:hypothetical protein